MVIASELKEGAVIRIDGRIYRVLEVESKAGAAKLGGVVKTKLSDVRSGRMWEPHFRPQERLEEVELERRTMEFLFSEGDTCTFMNPSTFEQVELPTAILGRAAQFLQPGVDLPVEFFAEEPLSRRSRSPHQADRAAGALATGQCLEAGHAGKRSLHPGSFVHWAGRNGARRS